MTRGLDPAAWAALDDRELVDAIAAHDAPALQEACRRHGARVHRVAAGLCGASHADEVVQDLFLRLWQRPEAFDPARGTLSAFLVASAHGRAIDVLRREQAWRARHGGRAAAAPEPVGVEASALAHLASEETDRLLRTLPPAEREVVELAYLVGHTYREVAALLGRPEGTVKGQMRSALGRLRTGLGAMPSWA